MQESHWIKNGDDLAFPSLQKDVSTEVLIIGGGITGVMLAYYLMQSEIKFILVEANEIGHGASGRNAGKITSQHALIYHYLSNKYQDEVALKYYQANEEAIDSIETIVKKHHLNCGFKRIDNVVYTNKEEETLLLKEYETCKRLKIPCDMIVKSKDAVAFTKGLRFYEQAQYNPLSFVQGVAEIVDYNGYEIYEHTPVKEVSKSANGYEVYCENHKICAQKVILATQFPFIDEGQLYFSKLFNEQSSIYCVKSDTKFKNQWISCDEQVRSFSTFKEANENFLFMGGMHHSVGRDCLDSTFLQECKKQFQVGEKIERWSSQDYLTADRIPLIGCLVEEDESLLFASGYQKWGNTLGCVAAKLLCAMILKTPSQYLEMFDPHRSNLLLNATSMKANFNTIQAFIKSKFQDSKYVMPSKGKADIVHFDDKDYGVYVDLENQAHILDIKCTHMGCTCVFNEIDKTWDCPCHGSRFGIDGEIIKGPATTSLQNIGNENEVNPHVFMRESE